MEITFLRDIQALFKNILLNSTGTQKTIYEYLDKKEVGKALSMLANRDADIDKALSEYNPELHEVMRRPNKIRENADTYITE